MPTIAVMDANFVIDTLGGTAATARLFEIEPASVSEWRKKGIPKARLHALRFMRPDLFAAQQTPVGDAPETAAA